jgi:glutaredoxin-like protein
MLRDEDKQEIQARLKSMRDPVSLVFFTQQILGACQFCYETERLMKELVALSGKLSLAVKNFVSDREDATRLGVDKIPAICLQGAKDHGMRIYGIPSGYEFTMFLESILRLSNGESGLRPESKTAIRTLDKKVHIQVFVTPTCPYCPRSALTGLQMAMESDFVTCDVVEISEFPHLAQKYGVMGVPKVVINENQGFEGAVSEALFVQNVVNAVLGLESHNS